MIDVSKISYDSVKKIYSSKNYEFNTNLNKINITGIRSSTPVVDKFDDLFVITYIDEKGSNCFIANGTTDPGLYWLNNPMKGTLGTAIVKEGFYKNMWTIGQHLGLYTALVQRNNCIVYRDSNRDGNLDLVQGTEQTGVFGINHHHANNVGTTINVGQWSAGCQVYANISDFNIMLALANKQNNLLKDPWFNYALINEKDLI